MRPRSGSLLGILCVLTLVAASIACSGREVKAVAAVLEDQLAGPRPKDVSAAVWADIRTFYTQRESTPAWVTGRNAKAGDRAIELLSAAPEFGLSAGRYGAPALADALTSMRKSDAKADAPARLKALAALDVKVTAALLSLGRDAALGRENPSKIDRRWKAQRKAPEFAASLNEHVGGDLRPWVESLEPKHPQYAALKQALGGLLAASSTETPTAADGPSADTRKRLLAINMDRWRWMPDDLGARHILVNIPAYELYVRDGGRQPLAMRVIVGEADGEHNTPVFTSDMTNVVFSPYWNIPETIAEGEIAVAAARDPSYLSRQNIDILQVSKSGTTPVDPESIDWDDPEALESLAFRQRPGAGNALGHIKFALDNPYAIYLHDTPADQLFAKPNRALSHGCVRLAQPDALAKYVLRDRPEWDDARIRDAMHSGEEQSVKLAKPIPVHITYFTAWSDDDAGIRYLPDVYGYDK